MSIFYVKNYPNLSQIFFIEEYQFRGMFFVVDIYWKLQFLKHFVNTKIMLIFRLLDLERMFIWKKKLWKNAIYCSIKLPFDAEVAEKILNVI